MERDLSNKHVRCFCHTGELRQAAWPPWRPGGSRVTPEAWRCPTLLLFLFPQHMGVTWMRLSRPGLLVNLKR